MLLTEEQFYTLYPHAKKHGDVYNNLATAMHKYDISGRYREAYFLGQLAHECVGFRYLYELGNKAYFSRYDGRKDLGNTIPGDGYKYRGRGFIQLTGRANYRSYGAQLGLDLEGNPDLASTIPVAVQVACLYWKNKGLNELADKGNFKLITRRINGGYNGLKDRVNQANKVYNLITKS